LWSFTDGGKAQGRVAVDEDVAGEKLLANTGTMPKKKSSRRKQKCTESSMDKRTKEIYLENIEKLVSKNENIDVDTLSAIEAFCNFDPKKTYETLIELFQEEKERENKLCKQPVNNSASNKISPWTSMGNKLKATLLKEKYSFASKDLIRDVLEFFEGSMERTENFLLENYPVDDPQVVTNSDEKVTRDSSHLPQKVALYLRELDALRISAEQEKNAVGYKQPDTIVQSFLDKSRHFWNQHLIYERLASITRKSCYSRQATEMKNLFENYSSQALNELTKRDSFSKSPLLDLHGFFVEEALFLLEKKIASMKESTTKRPLVIQCITGKGNGSLSGSRLGPAVENYCKEHHLVYKLEPGAVIVYIG